MPRGELLQNWNRSETETLINEMKKRPALWDRSNPLSKCNVSKKAAYVHIGKVLKMKPSDVQKKIFSIKKKFQRECLKVTKTMSKSDWFAFDSLKFLGNKYAAIITNITEQKSIEDDSNDEERYVPTNLCTTMNGINDTQSYSESSEEDKNNLWMNEENIDYNNSTNNSPADLSNTYLNGNPVNRIDTNRQTLSHDEYSAFSDLIAIKIRNLSNPVLRLDVQEQILKVIFAAEKRQYVETYSQEPTPRNLCHQSNQASGQCSPDSRNISNGEGDTYEIAVKAEVFTGCGQCDGV